VVLSRFELILTYPALASMYILDPLFAWLGLYETVTREPWQAFSLARLGRA
jgi:hypothetical protein